MRARQCGTRGFWPGAASGPGPERPKPGWRGSAPHRSAGITARTLCTGGRPSWCSPASMRPASRSSAGRGAGCSRFPSGLVSRRPHRRRDVRSSFSSVRDIGPPGPLPQRGRAFITSPPALSSVFVPMRHTGCTHLQHLETLRFSDTPSAREPWPCPVRFRLHGAGGGRGGLLRDPGGPGGRMDGASNLAWAGPEDGDRHRADGLRAQRSVAATCVIWSHPPGRTPRITTPITASTRPTVRLVLPRPSATGPGSGTSRM